MNKYKYRLEVPACPFRIDHLIIDADTREEADRLVSVYVSQDTDVLYAEFIETIN